MPRTATKSSASVEAPRQDKNDLADDLLVGAKPIGAFIGRPAREVYYLGATGRLPLFYWGTKLAGFKSTLRQHIRGLEKSRPVA